MKKILTLLLATVILTAAVLPVSVSAGTIEDGVTGVPENYSGVSINYTVVSEIDNVFALEIRIHQSEMFRNYWGAINTFAINLCWDTSVVFPVRASNFAAPVSLFQAIAPMKVGSNMLTEEGIAAGLDECSIYDFWMPVYFYLNEYVSDTGVCAQLMLLVMPEAMDPYYFKFAGVGEDGYGWFTALPDDGANLFKMYFKAVTNLADVTKDAFSVVSDGIDDRNGVYFIDRGRFIGAYTTEPDDPLAAYDIHKVIWLGFNGSGGVKVDVTDCPSESATLIVTAYERNQVVVLKRLKVEQDGVYTVPITIPHGCAVKAILVKDMKTLQPVGKAKIL